LNFDTNTILPSFHLVNTCLNRGTFPTILFLFEVLVVALTPPLGAFVQKLRVGDKLDH